ncbi:MAG: enoyl-CoA hydratase-related protein [Spongiibacteraceae bacterium]
MSELVTMKQHEEVAVITLNAPKTRNALAREVQMQLLDHLKTAAGDLSIKAIVLTGEGGHFCSGGDLNNMIAERTLTEGRERVAMGGEIARALMAGPKPVIAAVEGYAAGAGFSLAVAADYVVASTQSNFISAFCKVGLIPDIGMLWALAQKTSLSQAKRIIASARKLGAEEAQRLGIVDDLAEPGQVMDAAMAIAKEFSAGAPLPMAMIKQAYARGINSLEDALRCEMDNQSSLYLTKDHREAISAFLDKRQPQFKGC